MGIRDKPIAPASPWQNGFAERLIGSIRRECLDHVVVLGEAHLRRILKSYADYYNSVRMHRSLHKDAPISRPISSDRIHSFTPDPRRASPSLRPSLSFRYTQVFAGMIRRGA
jgi:transposase InsO family protein